MSAARSLRILAFGASLTEGFFREGFEFHPYTLRLAELIRSAHGPVDIHNAGVSGEAVLSPTMLPRLKHLLASVPSPFDWVLLLAGTNDTIRDQQKPSVVLQTYRLLVDECHRHGARVLVMTLPETVFPEDSPADVPRQGFNRLLREELRPTNAGTSKPNTVLLDVERLLPRHSLSAAEQKQIWDDELHLTAHGYDRLGELIFEALKSSL